MRRHRAHAARAVDDEDTRLFPFAHLHALHQRLPRRDPRQRQRGRLDEIQTRRLQAHAAPIHELVLGVRAVPDRASEVEDFVAGLEASCSIGSRGFDYAGAVVAEDLGQRRRAGVVVRGVVVDTAADFDVDGIDGGCFDSSTNCKVLSQKNL